MDEIGKFLGYKANDLTQEGNGKAKHIYDFDPSGLERAAKSAKILRDDPNASKILELAISETMNKRLELQKDQKALDLKIENAKQEAMKQQHEYSMGILKEEAKTHRTKAEYEDYLARKRQEDRIEIEKKSQIDLLKIQEESVKKQEELRRKTIDYEFSKKVSDDKELSEQYWKNKALYKNETKDLALEKKKIEKDYRLKMIATTFESVSGMANNAFHFFYDDKTKLLYAAATIVVMKSLLHTSRLGLNFFFGYIGNRLKTPKLVKESSVSKFPFIRKSFKVKDDLLSQGLIYNKQTETTLINVIHGTKVSLSNNGVLRNFLFYGPPGTGKTLFAKNMALTSGLNYAILSCGDVLPLKENAVTELHRVFDWSKRSKGLILFLDEADAFLKKRDQVEIGEDMRSALNTFLYRTGNNSKNIMTILATNKPEELDPAVTDRLDMMIEFPLPDIQSRTRLFEYYMNLHLLKHVNLKEISINTLANDLAKMSEGFSAREIAKLCNSWKITGQCHPEKVITLEEIFESMNNMINQHSIKKIWEAKHANKNN